MRWITLLLTLIMGCADMPPSGHFKDGVIDYAGANTPGWISNLEISYSAGTLTIQGTNGRSLSPNVPGWITVRSTTAGKLQTIKVKKNIVLQDDANVTSFLTGMGWNLDETANWASDRPFFLFVVNRNNTDIDGADGNSAFFIGQEPIKKGNITPAAVDIATSVSPSTNDFQRGILLLGNYTKANYLSLPITLIGCFRMQWATATTDWTVQALDNLKGDGIGFDALNTLSHFEFTMPSGQNGCAATKYIFDGASPAPAFGTAVYRYTVNPFTGIVTCYVHLESDGGADGADATAASLVVPYGSSNTTEDTGILDGVLKLITATPLNIPIMLELGGPGDFSALIRNGTAPNTSILLNQFPNGGRTIQGVFSYKPFPMLN